MGFLSPECRCYLLHVCGSRWPETCQNAVSLHFNWWKHAGYWTGVHGARGSWSKAGRLGSLYISIMEAVSWLVTFCTERAVPCCRSEFLACCESKSSHFQGAILAPSITDSFSCLTGRSPISYFRELHVRLGLQSVAGHKALEKIFKLILLMILE